MTCWSHLAAMQPCQVAAATFHQTLALRNLAHVGVPVFPMLLAGTASKLQHVPRAMHRVSIEAERKLRTNWRVVLHGIPLPQIANCSDTPHPRQIAVHVAVVQRNDQVSEAPCRRSLSDNGAGIISPFGIPEYIYKLCAVYQRYS